MAKNEQFDYAAKMSALETIIEKLQHSETSLDDAIRLHKEGKQLITELNTYLETAEVTIRKMDVEPS